MWIRDDGSWKEVKGYWVRDGGQWKEVKEAWVRDGGSWKKFYDATSAPTFLVDFGTVLALDATGNFASASAVIERSGDLRTIEGNPSGDTVNTPSDRWVEEGAKNSTFGDDYEVRAVVSSGTFTFGFTDWTRVNSDRVFNVTQSGNGNKAVTFKLQIRDFGGSTVLYESDDLTLSASVFGF